ncbi:hypothetical protein CR513_32104, partial [Mucuna pruriens]
MCYNGADSNEPLQNHSGYNFGQNSINNGSRVSLPSHVFGYVAFVHSHNSHNGKLDTKAVKCGESYLEVQYVIMPLPFPTQNVQVQEVTLEKIIIEEVRDEVGGTN